MTDYDHGRICSACGDVVIFCSCVAKLVESEAGGDSSESPAGD